MFLVAQISARAGVHGRHEHDVTGIFQGHGSTRDGHPALFQGLAQDFEDVLLEFGELVQKKHAPVGQGELSGTRVLSAADEPRIRNSVMRRSERPRHHQGLLRRQLPGHGIDLGHLQGFVEAQGGQNRWDAARKHGLAAARRADEKHVVRTGAGDFDGPLGTLLALDLGEVAPEVLTLGPQPLHVANQRVKAFLSKHEAHDLGQALAAKNRQALHHGGFPAVGLGHDHAPRPGLAGSQGQRQDARNGLEFPGKRKLPGHVQTGELALIDDFGPGQKAQGQGEIIARALLADIGRGDVHGDAAGRQLEARILECRKNALLGLAHRPLGQADHDEGRHARTRQVHLKLDGESVDSQQSGGGDLGDHAYSTICPMRSQRMSVRLAQDQYRMSALPSMVLRSTKPQKRES